MDANPSNPSSLYAVCIVCESEVPLSEAAAPEGSDYMAYFCGLDCYERWRNQPASADGL